MCDCCTRSAAQERQFGQDAFAGQHGKDDAADDAKDQAVDKELELDDAELGFPASEHGVHVERVHGNHLFCFVTGKKSIILIKVVEMRLSLIFGICHLNHLQQLKFLPQL